jgi:hypothetical protein
MNQRQHSEQVAKPTRIHNARRFQVESTSLERLKKALDFPALPIVKEQISRLIAGNEKPFLSLERFSSQVNRHLPEPKYLSFTSICPPKELAGFPLSIFLIENNIIFSDSNTKRNSLLMEKFEPVFSDKFPISCKVLNFLRTENLDKLLKYLNSMLCMAVSFSVQDDPEERHCISLKNDSKNEKVDRCFSPVPVGSIYRQYPGFIR